MPSFAEVWSEIEQEPHSLPLLLIDCAGVEGGEARLPKQIFSRLECLFTGDLQVELADVGPYLGQLRSIDEDVARSVEDLVTSQVASIVVLNARPAEGLAPTFADLHRHFRKFNVVYGPANEPLFFRYYDPRVLPNALDAFDVKQRVEFFGPAYCFLVADGARSMRKLLQ